MNIFIFYRNINIRLTNSIEKEHVCMTLLGTYLGERRRKHHVIIFLLHAFYRSFGDELYKLRKSCNATIATTKYIHITTEAEPET
jgi:hypothetical protein